MRYLLAVLLAAATLVDARAEAVTLIDNGKSAYVIVLPRQAEPQEQTAARELQDFLHQIGGAELPIRDESQVGAETPQIIVGQCERAQQLVPDARLRSPGPDGICIWTAGRHLVLTGARPRGSLYAVYTFLEDVAGCRWWTSTEATIPRSPTLEIPELHISYAPRLISREAFYRDAFNSPFAVRLKLNGHFMAIPREYGGHLPIVGWCHTFFQILPPAAYFGEHPEWYSEIGGKRSAERTQLCLTNQAMRSEFVRRVLEMLSHEEGPRIISVSQNDWGGRCQCPECAAIEQREGSPAGPLLDFVNAVAAEVEKKFPEVLVETLAYQYTRTAPRQIKPRRNVLIRLCTIECSFSQPLATGPRNVAFRHDLEQWSGIAPQLYVWNYVTNFSNFLLPHPNMRSLADDIRFFVQHNTIGLFEQGDAYSTTGDFIRLRTWVLAHLMWNPTLDPEALVREFLVGYYGAAAPHLSSYFEILHDAVQRADPPLRCFTRSTSTWLTVDVLNEATKRFDEAAAAVADDPVLTERVRRARIPLDHAWLADYESLRAQARRTGGEFRGPRDAIADCRQWIEQNRHFENRFYGEGRTFDEYADRLTRRFRPPAPVPDICRDLPEGQWLDIQDHRFQLSNEGTWAAIVQDKQASDGMAARMPANHPQWAIQYHLQDELVKPGRWRCIASVRCDAKTARGTAIHAGLYEPEKGRSLATITVPIKQCSGGPYTMVELGVHDLQPGMYFWFASGNNPEAVDAVYVDRLLLLKSP